jgi:hypothetical protein
MGIEGDLLVDAWYTGSRDAVHDEASWTRVRAAREEARAHALLHLAVAGFYHRA